jgi:hypothetical protein
MGQEPLQGTDLTPAPFPSCLRNKHLRSFHLLLDGAPIDGVPVRNLDRLKQYGGKDSEAVISKLIGVLIQTFLHRLSMILVSP